jgi:exodeoxyribonuclease V alpha subunit
MEYDFIIVDECSMVDMKLAYELFMLVKRNAKLLLVGDPDQLPSVGAGNVLREMIRSELVPVAVLDHVFRQADNSRIALNAYAVNHNDTHLLCGDDFVMLNVFNSEEAAELIIKHFLQAVEEKGVENVQILSPFRRRGAVSADSLNATIRDLVNPKRRGVNEIKSFGKTFREGDRVIQTKNSKDMANGDVGIITSIQCNTEGESTIAIKLLDGSECSYTEDEMETMEHSYCISIHKSQGGEFPVVIIPLLREHYVMLRRNLLYTAISRAKEKVVLVSQPQAIYTAIHKCDVDRRYTVLADRIRAYYNREQSKKKS